MMAKLALTSFALVLVLSATTVAQGRRPRPAPPEKALQYLPQSDAIIMIDTKRLLNEALRMVVGSDQAKQVIVNADVEKFKTLTGVDPRSFDGLTVSMRYTYPSEGMTKIVSVAIVRGRFDAKAMTAAMRAAVEGKYREEKFQGLTISVLAINDQIKVGAWNIRLKELGVCVLDPNTLAVGSPADVRAAIMAGKAGSRGNAALAALASRDPKALMSFGANITRQLLDNLGVGNDAVAKDVGSIKQLYGSISTETNGFACLLVARSGTPAEAAGVSEMVTGLRQLASFFIVRLPPPTRKLAQDALDGMKITTQSNETQIRFPVNAADLTTLIK